MRHTLILTKAVVLAGLFWGSSARAGVEARCGELGASCVCSEPLDTSTYNQSAGATWAWDPADTTPADKECNVSGQPGGFVEVNDFDQHYTTVSSGDPLAALPPGHTITHVLRLLDGIGGMFAGVKFNKGEPTARRGFRYYKYYSPDYSFTSDVPLCNSSKWAQMGFNGAGTGGPLMTEEWSFYDIEQSTSWNMNTACCSGPGPGNSAQPPNPAAVKGKWLRLEFYMNNTETTGTPTTFEAWLKNVTDDTPEVKIVDTSVPTDYANGANWTKEMATQLHPTKPITDMAINMFRSDNGQACLGYAAFSHFLAAAWGTNDGQRIGAAVEIEGNVGSGGAGGTSGGAGAGASSSAGASGQSSGAGGAGGSVQTGGSGGSKKQTTPEDSGGCACRASTRQEGGFGSFVLLALALGGACRRTRQRRAPSKLRTRAEPVRP
ncbi:MAG: hypothetical protein R3B13_35480 [Polyangiaceae bacterium]